MARSHRPNRRPRGLRAALVGLTLLAGGLVAGPLPAGAAAGQTEGVDVSHWQGTIDWTKVAGAGKTFAFLKASQGTTYRDPTYATNRTNANAVGIPTGAYHFADVTKSPSNAAGARAEAEWFVSVAQPKAGDLPPVFDIETTNGLGQVALTDWAMTWLERVRQLTGIYPMVYTSPSGWNTRFGTSGNTVAESGYGLLWVAHWTTATSPTVPANNWAGNGWTFWQYTSSGTVNGISGAVDLDRYKADTVAPLLLRQLTITKDFSSGKTGGVQQDGLGAFCNATCTATTRLSVGGATTTLTPQSADTATTWSWGGDCAGTPAGASCTLSMTADRDVTITYLPTSVPVTVAAAGTGNGSVSSNPAGIACTATAGVASGTCSAPFASASSVVLSATAASGSSFAGWSGACSGTGTCTLTTDAAKSVTATFQPATFSLTVARAGTGTGTTSAASVGAIASRSCAVASCLWSYPSGTSVPLTPTADAGSRFVGWSGICTGTGACSAAMTADRTVTAVYAAVVPRTLAPAATAITLRKGQYATFTGSLGNGGDTRCSVASQTVGLWTTTGTSALSSSRTTSSGAYTFSRRMSSTGTFTFVVKAPEVSPTTLGNAICGAATTVTITVTVNP